MSQYPPQFGPGMGMGGPVQPHRGTMILVLGILSLVLCPILGPIAWVMGNTDMQEMAAGRMDRSGEGMTQAGRICGMIATIIMIVELCCVIAYFAIFFVAIGAGAAAGG